ncbi:MAG: SDR family NAD(P)-dependent oxidoreductase [Candidatus Dormibacteraceae bacterium]
MDSQILSGRVAIVTGASKGIGAGLAKGLVRHSACVVVNYKNDEAGASAVCSAIAEAGGDAFAIRADVSRLDDVDRLVSETVNRYGRLDLLVNNAGRTRFGPADGTTMEDWDDVIGTNLRGPYFLTVAAVKHMKPGGSIVNISSCAAKLMVQDHSLYTLSKTGVEGLTRQMALEYAPRQIRVNCIAPAATSIERNWQYDPNFDATWARVTPMGRVALPEDYVGTVVYLASDMSSFLTGAILNVDGGWSIKGHTPDMADYAFETDRQRG